MIDPEKIAKLQKIDEHHVKSFAYLVGRLQATPDGDGTLLDHSMLLYGSSIRDGNVHDHHDLPLVLVGGKSVDDQGRSAYPVQAGDADDESAADDAR